MSDIVERLRKTHANRANSYAWQEAVWDYEIERHEAADEISQMRLAIRALISEATGEKSKEDMLWQLACILGDPHIQKASADSDCCALCYRDLRDAVHLRITEVNKSNQSQTSPRL